MLSLSLLKGISNVAGHGVLCDLSLHPSHHLSLFYYFIITLEAFIYDLNKARNLSQNVLCLQKTSTMMVTAVKCIVMGSQAEPPVKEGWSPGQEQAFAN